MLSFASARLAKQRIFSHVKGSKGNAYLLCELLPLIKLRYPFLEYIKGSDNSKLITCHITKIPGIAQTLIPHILQFQHINIEKFMPQDGKIIVELGRQPANQS